MRGVGISTRAYFNQETAMKSIGLCFFLTKDNSAGSFQFVPGGVWRFVDGKIAEEWVFSNDLDLYRQLGLFKEPGSTDH
jgi:hypothetical protein